MNRSECQDRAKQFMPFDTLKGLKEELRNREDKVESNGKELTEEEEWLYD